MSSIENRLRRLEDEGAAVGAARGVPPDVVPTMNELIRGGTGRGVLWTDGG